MELLESMDYYSLQQSGLGQRFLNSLIEGLNRIIAHPEIIAVMHLNRDPGYWKSSVPE